MMEPVVDILLATYNGEKYLLDQLASIKRQTYPHWRIIARDDGSSDDTVSILYQFAQLFPNKVQILPTDKNLGVIGNFSALLQASKSPYTALCDQDDIWDDDKLSIQMEAIQKLEEQTSKNTPLLIHSDARLVTENLKPIAPSFWKFAHLYPDTAVNLNRLLAQNVVTGCALICNHSLVQLAAPIPKEALMHDWWLALTASAFGQIGIIPKTTLSYRQHSNNTLGAVRFCSYKHLHSAWKRFKNMAQKKREQAQAFLQTYNDSLDANSKNVLNTYISLDNKNFIQSRWTAYQAGFRKQGLLRQIATIIFQKFP